MSLPYIVSCARCGMDWIENDDLVRYVDGDWFCLYEDDCTDRVYEWHAARAEEEETYGITD